MSVISNLKLLFSLNSLISKINKAHGSGFNFQVAAKKFLINFVIVVVALGAAAFADFFSVPANLDLLFSWLPESVRDGAHTLLGPAIAAGLFALKNWATNRKNEIIWVVETEAPVGDEVPVVKPDAVPVPLSVKPSVLGPPAPVEPIQATGKQVGA